jgi:hypothetical protein
MGLLPEEADMDHASILQWMEQSQWVVRATVEAVGSSTVGAAPASEKTVTVRIDDILHGPEAFVDHRGRIVTVYSERTAGLAEGHKAIFFARSWLYGESIAVVEVGRLDEQGTTDLSREIEAAQRAITDQKLLQRLKRAELVIVGVVVRTEPARGTQRRHVETEHDPEWWTAYVEVTTVEMGRAPEHVVPVLFAASRDEMWIDSPKLVPGHTYLLILQRNQTEKGWPVLRVPGLTALDPLDVRPPDELERIRSLIRQ